jgi:hypothetical protein
MNFIIIIIRAETDISFQTDGFPKAAVAMTLTKYEVFSIGQSLWGDHPENRRLAQLPSPRL